MRCPEAILVAGQDREIKCVRAFDHDGDVHEGFLLAERSAGDRTGFQSVQAHIRWKTGVTS